MNRMFDPETRFTWPRARNSVLKTKLVNGTFTEHSCMEALFVEKVNERYNETEMIQIGRKWGESSMLSEIAIPIFVGICKNTVNEGPDSERIRRYKNFYVTLNQFYEKHSNVYMELNIGKVHFHLNHLMVVIGQIVAHAKRDDLELGIQDFVVLKKNVTYLFHLAASEELNIALSKCKKVKYPETSLFGETMQLILESKESTLPPTIQLNNEIKPVSVDNGIAEEFSIELGEGIWLLVTIIGPRVGLFGHTVIPKYRVCRFIRFFSRVWGPGEGAFWNLNGFISFDFGTTSQKVLEISVKASDDQWRELKMDAINKKEFLPEPLASTTAFRILGSYAEY